MTVSFEKDVKVSHNPGVGELREITYIAGLPVAKRDPAVSVHRVYTKPSSGLLWHEVRELASGIVQTVARRARKNQTLAVQATERAYGSFADTVDSLTEFEKGIGAYRYGQRIR